MQRVIKHTRMTALTNITAGNTLTLQAPQITGASTTWGGDQQTNLLLAINSKEISHTETSRNLLWQSSQSNGTIAQNAQFTNINVPIGMSSFVGAGGISVQLPKGAPLSVQLENLAKQPGLEYLNDLSTRSDIDWKRVEIINKTWDYKKEGLTPEAKILVAIAVSIIMPANVGANLLNGMLQGSGLVLTGTGVAMANAAMVTLATQTAVAVIENKGDLGAALKQLGSNENIKALVTAIATAGLLDQLGSTLNLKGGADLAKASFVEKLQTYLINGVASSLINTAINGGSIEDALINAIKGAVINAAGAELANGIGDLKATDKLDLFSGTIAHAILGCAMGSATAGSSSGCAAGAGGAVVGEISAEWYGKTFGGTYADIANFAKLTTAIAGLVGGANAMNIAGITSNNAVVNNYLNHVQQMKLIELFTTCNKEKECENKVIKDYVDLSISNDKKLLQLCNDPKSASACNAAMKESIEYAGNRAMDTFGMSEDRLRSAGVNFAQAYSLPNGQGSAYYDDRTSRNSFYTAAQDVAAARGNQVVWPQMAADVTGWRLGSHDLLTCTFGSGMCGISQEINGSIFNRAFNEFGSPNGLLTGSRTLTGESARLFDRNMVLIEQTTAQTTWDRAQQSGVNSFLIQYGAQTNGWPGLPGVSPIQGSIFNLNNRLNYGYGAVDIYRARIPTRITPNIANTSNP